MIRRLATAVLSLALTAASADTLPDNHGQLQTQLFLGTGDQQKLVVGFGGSEGGNAWASRVWATEREKLLAAGYALLAVGYFGRPGLPPALDRIELSSIRRAIREAQADPRVVDGCAALVGGSKGAELALVLASRFPDDAQAVVALVPGDAVFPALTMDLSTSSWALDGQPLPFAPMTEAAVAPAMRGDKRAAFTAIRAQAPADALIPIDRLKAPLLLMSATQDELWPSREMADNLMRRLDAAPTAPVHEHRVFDGGHTVPQQHLSVMRDFLDRQYRCPTPAAAR